MTSATVVITSDPPTLAAPSDVMTSSQITSALVTPEDGASEEHISIWPPLNDGHDLQRRLKGLYPDAIVSTVTNNADGACECSTESRANRFAVAAALTVVKRSWGWDEIDPTLVRVNGLQLRVHARHDGNAWTVTEA
jgi:hypothetical protein